MGVARHLSLIKLPISGDKTINERFDAPVKKAKIVPSIFLGVTLAKYDIIGIKKMVSPMTPIAPLAKNMYQKLDMPIDLFHCSVKTYTNKDYKV